MLIKSQLLSVMSGSLDATVASHNRFGRYLRAKTIPTNPNTGRQVTVRQAMAELVERWSATLDAAQRTAWATYAANVPMTNRVGDTIYLTALNQYVRSNVPRIQAGLAIVDDGPTVLTLPSFTPITAMVDNGDHLELTFTNADAWANEAGGALLAAATAPQPSTINFNALPFRYAGKVAGASPTPPTSPQSLTTPISTTGQQGNAIFIRARITRADGRLSIPQLIRCIITV